MYISEDKSKIIEKFFINSNTKYLFILIENNVYNIQHITFNEFISQYQKLNIKYDIDDTYYLNNIAKYIQDTYTDEMGFWEIITTEHDTIMYWYYALSEQKNYNYSKILKEFKIDIEIFKIMEKAYTKYLRELKLKNIFCEKR